MTPERKARESLSFEESLSRLGRNRRFVNKLIGRLDHISSLSWGAKIVEVGCAQGLLCICLLERGFNAVGIEPSAEALKVALRHAEHEKIVLDVREGVAECLPLADRSSDAVIAASVIEHVLDVEGAFREAFRILKPGGIFWFSAASSICPYQKEIDSFPLFAWYPTALKLRIMDWVKRKKPHLVGHTQTPAINWFTPWKARQMLRKAGFAVVYDRWDLRLLSEGGWAYRLALRTIRLCSLTKLVADLVCEGCAYAGVKTGDAER